MEQSTLAAADLKQLRSLASSTLTYISLTYSKTAAAGAAAAAAAWRDLAPALESLVLEDDEDEGAEPELVPRSVVQGLHPLASLTKLELGAYKECEAPLSELAGAIAGLTLLRVLSLAMGYQAAPKAEVRELVSVIVGLPWLTELKLDSIPLGLVAVQLTKLTQLESLSMICCELNDLAVNAIVLSLTRLIGLDLIHNSQLKGSFMPAVAKLPQLRELSLYGASARDATISFLSSFQELRTLELVSAPKVRARGRAALEAALPRLFVDVMS